MKLNQLIAAAAAALLAVGISACRTTTQSVPEDAPAKHAKGGCSHGKAGMKGGCSHGKAGMKGGCDHGKAGMKGGCDHGKKAVSDPNAAKKVPAQDGKQASVEK